MISLALDYPFQGPFGTVNDLGNWAAGDPERAPRLDAAGSWRRVLVTAQTKLRIGRLPK